jgi:hypothetical protein
MNNQIFSYSDIEFELDSLKLEIKSMNLEILLEECLYFCGEYNEDLNSISLEFALSGEIDPRWQEPLETLYTLYYIESGWEA